MKTVKLKDICELITRGISPIYTENEERGVTVLNQKCIRNKALLYEFSKMHNISAKPVNQSKFVKTGDILINSTGHGTLGRTALAENISTPTLVDSHVTILRPIEGVFESKYLAYLIGRCENDFIKMAIGTSGQTELPRALLSEYEVSYEPSLEEQQKIVAQLDAAFEKIDLAIELMEKNIKNTQSLFFSMRDLELSKATKQIKAGEAFVLQRGYDLPKSHRSIGRYELISSSGPIDLISEHKVDGPGVCTGRSGSVGSTFYVNNNFWPLNTTLYIKDFLGNNPRYCYWILKSMDLKKLAGGTGVPTLNRNVVHDQVIPVCEPGLQAAIAARIDTAHDKCEKLTNQYKLKASHLKALKQSLLAQAFFESTVK